MSRSPRARSITSTLGHHLAGPLDADALGSAVRRIAARHEVLRTTFAIAEGRPVQVIAPEADAPQNCTDLGGFPESAWRGEAERLATEEARTPFDMRRGPP